MMLQLQQRCLMAKLEGRRGGELKHFFSCEQLLESSYSLLLEWYVSLFRYARARQRCRCTHHVTHQHPPGRLEAVALQRRYSHN
jgi:hypothetical protein